MKTFQRSFLTWIKIFKWNFSLLYHFLLDGYRSSLSSFTLDLFCLNYAPWWITRIRLLKFKYQNEWPTIDRIIPINQSLLMTSPHLCAFMLDYIDQGLVLLLQYMQANWISCNIYSECISSMFTL
jgi:hypothetical protein